MQIPSTCDVVVIGGGPAGSSVATLLAQKDYHVVLLEKVKHPRFTVGESLLPQAWRYLDTLGVTPAIEAQQFIKKSGGTIVLKDRIYQMSFSDFGYTRPGLHVERDSFDHVLLQHAGKSGVDVFESVTVKRADLSEDDRQVVSYADSNGDSGSISCRIVVDASGQSAVLSRQLDIRVIDEDFRFVALWGYFRDSKFIATDGKPYPFDRIREVLPTTYVATIDDWIWGWHIPMRELTSVGMVIPLERFKLAKREEDNLEQYFLQNYRTIPYFEMLLQDAEYMEGMFHCIRDYSYVPKQVTGPGFFIVGDAAAFVDPIFSLGVVLALNSGHLAAWAIDRSLRRPGRLQSNQAIYNNQFRGFYELARSMAIPGREITEASNKLARRYVEFQSDSEQDLLYAATVLTGRAENFDSVVMNNMSRDRIRDKYRELESIEF